MTAPRIEDTPWTERERRRWAMRFPRSPIRVKPTYPQVINKEAEEKRRALLLRAERRRDYFLGKEMDTEKLRITAAMVRDIIVDESRLSWAEITSARRHRPIAQVRMVTSYLLKRYCTHLSFPAIGRMLKRDHSTVVHAVETVGELIENAANIDAADPRADALRLLRVVERRLGVE